MTENNQEFEIQKLLGQTLTAGELRKALDSYADDTPVLIVSDCVDTGLTHQVLPLVSLEVSETGRLILSGYSNSGVAYREVSRTNDGDPIIIFR